MNSPKNALDCLFLAFDQIRLLSNSHISNLCHICVNMLQISLDLIVIKPSEAK